MTVDKYLAALPTPMRRCLQELRQTILAAAPECEELISYNIPTYKQNGPIVHFAAFANHCSLVTVNITIVEVFSKELANFKISGTTIQFTPDRPLPEALVKKIVALRLEQNSEKF